MMSGIQQKKRKKVIIVHGYCQHFWGSEKVALDVGESYRNLGYEIIFFLPGEGCFTDMVRQAGFSVEIQDTIIPSLRRPREKSRFFMEVLWRIGRIKPDLVHSTSLGPVPTLAFSTQLLKIKLMAQLQTKYDDAEMRRRCLSKVDICLPVSQSVKNASARFLKLKQPGKQTTLRKLSPAIEAPDPQAQIRAKELRKVWKIQPGELVIGMVGQIIPRKGTDLFLKSIAALVKNGIKIKAVLVGESPKGFEYFNQEIKDLITSLGLENHLIQTGFVKDVAAHFAAMDILAMPSRVEGLGLVAGESMLAGVPVVAANVGGLKELIRDRKNGILVEPDCYNALTKGLESLILNRNFRMKLGKAGKKSISKHYSQTSFEKKLKSVIKELHGNHSPSLFQATAKTVFTLGKLVST